MWSPISFSLLGNKEGIKGRFFVDPSGPKGHLPLKRGGFTETGMV